MRIESLRDLHGQFPDIDGFWDFNDFFKTEFHITNLLPKNDEEWTPQNVEALTQLARVQGLTGRNPQARITLEKAKSLIEHMDEAHRPRAFMRYLLEQGRIYCLAMTPAKALPCFQQCWTLANESGEFFFAIDAAIMISITQPPKFQNEWLQKALSLAEDTKSGTGRLWLSQLYLMDGWHRFDFRQYDLALESFQKASQQPQVPGSNRSGMIQWCIARALRALHRSVEALDIQQALHTKLTEQGASNGHVYLEIGECLQALQQHEEARTFFEAAYKELSADGWYSDNKATELVRMQFLSKRR